MNTQIIAIANQKGGLIISRTRKSAFLEALTNYVSGLGR